MKKPASLLIQHHVCFLAFQYACSGNATDVDVNDPSRDESPLFISKNTSSFLDASVKAAHFCKFTCSNFFKNWCCMYMEIQLSKRCVIAF